MPLRFQPRSEKGVDHSIHQHLTTIYIQLNAASLTVVSTRLLSNIGESKIICHEQVDGLLQGAHYLCLSASHEINKQKSWPDLGTTLGMTAILI